MSCAGEASEAATVDSLRTESGGGGGVLVDCGVVLVECDGVLVDCGVVLVECDGVLVDCGGVLVECGTVTLS